MRNGVAEMYKALIKDLVGQGKGDFSLGKALRGESLEGIKDLLGLAGPVARYSGRKAYEKGKDGGLGIYDHDFYNLFEKRMRDKYGENPSIDDLLREVYVNDGPIHMDGKTYAGLFLHATSEIKVDGTLSDYEKVLTIGHEETHRLQREKGRRQDEAEAETFGTKYAMDNYLTG